MTDIIFEPMISLFAIAAMSGSALALVGYAYARGARHVAPKRRALLALLRCLAIAAIAVILMKPMRAKPAEARARKPLLSILVDTSRSMNTEDVDGASRLDAEQRILCKAEGMLADLSRDYDIEWYEFSEKASSTSASDFQKREMADGGKTLLGEGVLDVLKRSARAAESAGLLLFSDGRNNGAQDIDYVARHAKSLGVRIWTCCIGTAVEAKDVAVVSRTGNDFVFINQKSEIKADILQQGYDTSAVKVQLLREGRPAAEPQWAAFEGESTRQVAFPIIEQKKGLVKYTLLAEPLEGEKNLTNNKRTVFVNVIDEKMKVLFLDGEPYWDSKFLAQTLRQDPNIALTSIFRVSRDRYFGIADGADGGKVLMASEVKIPYTRKELFACDVVILGRLIDSMVDDDYVKLLSDFLTEKGGVIVFARGKPNLDGLPDLKKLEPIVWGEDVATELIMEVTAEGRANPTFHIAPGEPSDAVMKKLPRLLAAQKPSREKSLAVVLARAAEDRGKGDKCPIVVFQRCGKGKVMSISAAGLWRWAFVPDRLKDYDTAYARFWGQMLRWLVSGSDFLPGSEVTLQTNAMSYSLGDEVKFYLRTRFASQPIDKPVIELLDPSGERSKFALYPDEDMPGVYTASYFPRRQGEHTAMLGGAGDEKSDEQKAMFTVYADTLEDLRVAADPKLMRRLAELSGGAAIETGRLGDLRGLLDTRRGTEEEDVEYVEIWDRGIVFWFIACVFGVEWFARRRSGLC